MGAVSTAIARQPGHPCACGCGALWNGEKDWVTCWACPGRPLAFTPKCGKKHVRSAACRGAHARGAEGAADAAGG